MKSFGLGGVVVRWIKAYFSGRVPRVHVDGEHSGAIPMHSGVPPGSVIGPLLFLLFVNDFPDVLEADVLEYEPSKFSYCCMGLVEEMGPTDQLY